MKTNGITYDHHPSTFATTSFVTGKELIVEYYKLEENI